MRPAHPGLRIAGARPLSRGAVCGLVTCRSVQIAADSIEIVRREKVVGYEMSLMSQDELMELLGMTKVCRLTPPQRFSVVGAV